jgi:hypothetical protein
MRGRGDARVVGRVRAREFLFRFLDPLIEFFLAYDFYLDLISATHRSKRSELTTSTSMGLKACGNPHSSKQLP